MIRRVAVYFLSIPPVFTDGALYVSIAVFGFLLSQLGSEEALKYISAANLFWTKLIFGTFLAGFTALKMFRSTSYADHVTTKQNEKEPPTN